jgi:general secretion pathway protein K
MRINLNSRKSSKQKGFAILSAMIIMVLVATLSAATVWREWQLIQEQSYARTRLQIKFILSGAMHYAQLVLQDDAKKTGGQVVALTDPWHLSIENLPLATLLNHLKMPNTDPLLGKDAIISLSIDDAQARLNLASIAGNTANSGTGGNSMPNNLMKFTRLFQLLHISKENLDKIIRALNTRSDSDSTKIPIQPQTVQDLGWLGVSIDVIEKITPYVTFLPNTSTINVNTASSEVLSAAVPGLSPSGAKNIVDKRKVKPFTSLSEAAAAAQSQGLNDAQQFSLNSSYFIVTAIVSYSGITIKQTSLVRRQQNKASVLWSRMLPVIASQTPESS